MTTGMPLRVAVIGAGPGGYVAAIRAAQLGAAVTLIERAQIGGTCLNVGCIPTKALLHTAELYEQAKAGAAVGVDAQVTLNFAQAQAHKTAVVKQLVNGVRGLLKANDVTVVSGDARITGPGRLTIRGATGDGLIEFDRLIIAAGSVPAMPKIPGIESRHCIDSTGALALETVPTSMVVIGGGVIGVELATVYSAIGCKVAIVEMLDGILPTMDAELAGLVRADLAGRGVEILTGAEVMAIEEISGESVVKVRTAEDGSRDLRCEKVLVSVGRKPNVEGLGLESIGISCDRGAIIVDDRMQTNVSGVYAIGDCNGRIMLAHVASAQGEVAAENATGHTALFDPKTNAACVYTHPEFAGVGLTERQAKAKRPDHIVARFPFQANGKALIENGGCGMIKIIAGAKHREILGVHIYGPRATDLIAEAALAIGLEATVDELIATIHAHPTISEVFREAALLMQDRPIHVPRRK